MINFQQALDDIKQYVISYYDLHHDPDLLYHNLKHTKEVVAAVTKIANHYQLSDDDFFVVIAAAWFHDTGYLLDKTTHEAKSAEIATSYLKKLNFEEPLISNVVACIMATCMPQNPQNLLQQIICDADLFHLGTDDYRDMSKLLRKEIVAVKHVEMDKDQWRQKNIEFLQSQNYFTDYARLLLNDQKRANLEKLQAKQQEVSQPKTETIPEPAAVAVKDKPNPEKTDKVAQSQPQPQPGVDKKKKKDKPERGIETMFRITSGNNQRLSDMADNKAHILITVNSIILSAIISLVLRKLEENSFLAIPTFILLAVSLTSMTFSILATRPSIPEGTFNQADIDEKRVNLLFFGNFYKMKLQEYTGGMLKVMADKDFLYGTLIRDVYSQGVVLGRKYHLLRIAYNIFMFGLIVAVIAFIIASIIHSKAENIVPVHH